ncbi:3-oxoacyl-ACP synthase [Spirochaeta isovalerica]|uniref:3-oxoacyl-[acyl-carrier-protein] synthase-3 n=1 Tax=Spirochaeta isovalerica TaxID=150 RepID=A0A841REW8_9SPIO|nr:3-oxoacyl-ACP synthase [Spirochaeta isovalerica]MBB6482533.1 3-oxoacyl-[acyl-carrier-protein] synthase-3 [Spirochaeta isovalerica]
MSHVGVMGIGTYTPESKMDASEIASLSGIPENVIREKFGVDSKPVPGPQDSTSHMGIEAAKNAIEMAGIDPAEIDILIWNGAQHKDYLNWLAGLYVADQIGAVNAWSFDMEAMCGSMMAGIEVARSLLLSNSDYKTALLVSGYRNGDMIDYSVPETSFMFDIGAGGSAMVLRKDLGRNEILGSAFKGDGSFSQGCIVKAGGSRNWPVKPEDAGKFRFEIDDVEDFKKKLGERTLPNFYKVIRESLAKGGLTDEDLDYLAILHFKRSTHNLILEELKLTDKQTTYLNEFGHIGQNDQVISIEEGLADGKIKDGDNIVMVGAGIGFVWAAAALRWGPVLT